MAMVFCRGCGKELHETAPSCPHCGYLQTQVSPADSNSNWMAITVSVLALLEFLNWFGINNWTKSIKDGLWIFSIATIVIGALSIQQKRKGFSFVVGSIIIAALTILILIGNG